MRSTVFFLAAGAIVSLLLVAFTPISLQSSEPNSLTLPPVGSPDQVTAQRGPVLQGLSQMPPSFTKNVGQWDDRVLFRADAGGATMWFTQDGVYHQFTRRLSCHSRAGGNPESVGQDPRGLDNAIEDRVSDSIEYLLIKASFVGANPNPSIVGEGMMQYKCNYFLGNDPAKWRTDVPSYQGVVFEDVYQGIDLKYYGDGKRMEHDFIVSPGADLSQIQVRYEGAKALSVNQVGELVVETEWGTVTELRPAIYQIEDGRRKNIAGQYQLVGSSSFGFKSDEEYNPELAVVIDPVLTYSTYLGGGSDDGWPTIHGG